MLSLLFLCLIGASLLEKRVGFSFPCAGCGEPTFQKKSVFMESPLICDLCRLDVATASQLERADIHRHENRSARWLMLVKTVSNVGLILCPAFRYLETNGTLRGLLFLWIASVPAIGLALTLLLDPEHTTALVFNAGFLAIVWMLGLLNAQRRET